MKKMMKLKNQKKKKLKIKKMMKLKNQNQKKKKNNCDKYI